MKVRRQKGFTLIELAIVIAIIGILAAVAVPRFSDLAGSAEQAVAESVLSSLQSSAAIYVAEQRQIPTQFADFVVAQGQPVAPQTMTLENVVGQLQGGAAPAIADPLVLTFKSGGVATYTLNGTEVTATYAGF